MPKLLSDSLVIARLYHLPYQRDFFGNVVFALLTPLSMLVLTHFFLPAEQARSPRLVAGALVFSLGVTTVFTLSSTVYSERFYRRFKLVILSPIHKASYAGGLLLAGLARSLPNALGLLLAAPLFGIEIHLSLWLLPLLLLTVLSMSGLAFLIGTWVPSLQMGEICTNLASVTGAMVSPIFYDISRLPEALQWLARLSPYTHAASSLNSVLSGGPLAYSEFALLLGLSLSSLVLGVMGMRWREA